MRDIAPAKGLPTDIAASLGRMIARHSLLETLLSESLYRLAGVDNKIGRVTIGNPRGSDVLERMLECAQIRNMDLSPFPWLELKKTLDDLKTRRDMFAHGPWVFDSEERKYLVVVTKGHWPKKPNGPPRLSRKIAPEGKEITASDLKILRKEIEAAIEQAYTLDRFVQLTVKVRGGSSPCKLPSP